MDTLPKPQRGRPAAIQPAGRDMAAELSHLKEWLGRFPIYKPGTISVAAGLHRASLTHVLSGYRSPQANAMDAVYEVLKPYGYIPLSLVSANK